MAKEGKTFACGRARLFIRILQESEAIVEDYIERKEKKLNDLAEKKVFSFLACLIYGLHTFALQSFSPKRCIQRATKH